MFPEQRRSERTRATPFVFPAPRGKDSALLHVIGRTYFRHGDAIGYLAAYDRARTSTKLIFNLSNSILMSRHSQDRNGGLSLKFVQCITAVLRTIDFGSKRESDEVIC